MLNQYTTVRFLVLIQFTGNYKIEMETILITGSCGFIGMHLSIKLLELNYKVIGVDNMNNFYEKSLKYARLKNILKYKNFEFIELDIVNLKSLELIFKQYKPSKVVNLAGQAGVRYSLENPHTFIDSNVVGFMNILECCRHFNVEGLIYASSSSVYGGNKKIPFSISDDVNKPISIYAATKKSNELMAYTYSHLYGLNTTGLRYFTVYGPWGRPDMALYIFVNHLINNKALPIFNQGSMKRDFTYIDDIVNGTISSIVNNYPYEVFNLGSNRPERLLNLIKIIEQCLGKKAKLNLMDMQPGDVEITYADIGHSKEMLKYSPSTKLIDGVTKFIQWYKDYYNI